MTVIAELNQLINLLEATIPANPNSPANERLAERLQRSLAKYFRALEDAFPYSRLDGIYNRYVRESLGSDTGNILDPLLATFDETLQAEVGGQLAETYISGQAEMISWGQTKAGIPIAYEGPPIQQAIDWAEKHGAQLVTQMDDETKQRLAKVISDGIENKRGIPGLTRDIRSEFADMSKYRSQLIAKTETRQALFQASHDNMVDMGIDGKEWVLGAGGVEGNCEYCQANAAAGVIPVTQEFPNPEGDIHPGCTCAIAPARLPEKEPAGEGPEGKEWEKTLTPEERQTVLNWQDDGGYTRIREAQKAGIDTPETRLFEKALNKDGSYDGTTYRGLHGMKDRDINAILRSKEITLDADSSSSISRAVAKKFAQEDAKGDSILFRIKGKTGVDISNVVSEKWAVEKEVILKKGTKYTVGKVTRTDYMGPRGFKVLHEVVLTEV